MIDPIGVMPAFLLTAEAKTAAVYFIKLSPWDSTTKVRIAKGWAALVGEKFTFQELDAIDASGIDARTERGS